MPLTPLTWVLVVNAVHEDEPFSVDQRVAVDAEIDDLATRLNLQRADMRTN